MLQISIVSFDMRGMSPPGKFDVLKSHSDAFWALKCEFIITMYQIFINVSTDFYTILHGYYYEDQLATYSFYSKTSFWERF